MHDKTMTFHTSVMFEDFMQIQGITTTWLLSVHAVLKDFVQRDSLWNKMDTYMKGQLMRFHCSEGHLCAYHNHSYTGNVLPHCKQGRIYEVCFHGWLSSFLDYHLFGNTKYIFCKSFSPVVLTVRKVPKEIYNIIVHMQSLWFSVRFGRKLSSLTYPQEEDNNTSEW